MIVTYSESFQKYVLPEFNWNLSLQNTKFRYLSYLAINDTCTRSSFTHFPLCCVFVQWIPKTSTPCSKPLTARLVAFTPWCPISIIWSFKCIETSICKYVSWKISKLSNLVILTELWKVLKTFEKSFVQNCG